MERVFRKTKKSIGIILIVFAIISITSILTSEVYAYSESTKTLKYGSRGDSVKWLQTKLNSFGYNLSVDGKFGLKTLSAVKKFQKSKGLAVDGKVGPATRAALNGTTTTTTTDSTSAGQKVANLALKYKGYKYVSGGNSPSGFDCSGFTQYIFKQFGVNLPHGSKSQLSYGTKISKANLKVGDLVIMNSNASHAGIYIGDGKIIHASNPTDGVKITELKYMYFYAARRLV